MKIQNGYLRTPDKFWLYWKAWLPKKKPVAVINIVHGYAEHINRYGNVINAVIDEGYAVIGIDHRGHGRSDGKRCHVNSFLEYTADEKQFTEEVIKKLFPKTKNFMLGHSMGSIVALRYILQYPDDLHGLIISGTGSKAGKGTDNRLSNALARIGSKIFPKVNIKFPLAPAFISRDPEVVNAYINDPYTYDILTPRLAEQMAAYVKLNAHDARNISLPLLMQCGTEDISFAGQQELFDSFASKDKTFKFYKGLRHEIYNELPEDKKIVLADLTKWLKQHSKK